MIVLNSLLMALECFFGGSLVLALALLLAQGKPASQRHLIITGAFAVLLLLPLASLALPSHMVWQLAAIPQETMPQACRQPRRRRGSASTLRPLPIRFI